MSPHGSEHRYTLTGVVHRIGISGACYFGLVSWWPMALPLLTARALNRATLARQLLLERVSLGPLEASEMVAGLQAQTPTDPYVALWSRLAGFDPDELSRSIEERKAVRAQLMRATIHLVTANDYPLFAGATRTVLERVFRSTPFAKALNGADMPRILEVSREALAEQPLTRADLARVLAAVFPGVDGPAMAQAATYSIPVVQVPPRGLWRRSGAARGAVDRVAGPRAVAARLARRADSSLPGRLRSCHRRRRSGMVESHASGGGARAAPQSALGVPGRTRTRALRPAGCSPSPSGYRGAGAVPAGVRQRAPVAC